jgi:hypothetical protein
MTVKVAIVCDDICPQKGAGLYIDFDQLKYLRTLYDEFGAKTTIFMIPRLDNKDEFDIRNNYVWVKKIKQLEYLRIGAHGLTHQGIKPEYKAQEFVGLPLEEIKKRVLFSKQIFNGLGIDVKGFKSPGWAQPKEKYSFLKEAGFVYCAEHFIGQIPIYQEGIWRIPYTKTINKVSLDDIPYYTNGLFILHSHINNPDGYTENVWSKENYQKVYDFLTGLKKVTEVEFVFLDDLFVKQRGVI